jgi:hypothetical protein
MSTELVTQQQSVPVILCVGGSTRPDSSSEKARQGQYSPATCIIESLVISIATVVPPLR